VSAEHTKLIETVTRLRHINADLYADSVRLLSENRALTDALRRTWHAMGAAMNGEQDDFADACNHAHDVLKSFHPNAKPPARANPQPQESDRGT
jgi:hypothetical protein